jgi:hypothetical protein
MKRKEYGPSDGARMLRSLREAAQQIQKEEFIKILSAPATPLLGSRVAPVQLQFKFE